MRLWIAGMLAALLLPGSAFACTVTDKVAMSAGPYSPAALAAGKAPQMSGLAGLTCRTTLIVLLGGNYIRGTFTSANGLTLKNGTKALPYTLFADSGGTVPIAQNQQIDYMQNNLLNVLGLLGGSNATLPLYVRPGSASGLPFGSYTDTISVAWDWRICSVAYVLGNCAGTLTQGTGRTDVSVTVTVGPQDMTIAIRSVATWDTVDGTSTPRALPGSKGRTSFTVGNPDLVALDAGSIAIVYKIPAKTSVALDGDGSSTTAFAFTDGSPVSGTSFSYVPGSSSDDVDFSADGGATWTYMPVAGDRTSEAAVTHLRLRPRGAMRAGTSFTLSVPYLVR